MRTALIVGLGVCALALAACGDVNLADANLNTLPLWTIRDGTASLLMPSRSPSESEAVLRIDNHHLSYSIAYNQHRQGALETVLEYSDDGSKYDEAGLRSRDR
jgi:hypothetical protein